MQTWETRNACYCASETSMSRELRDFDTYATFQDNERVLLSPLSHTCSAVQSGPSRLAGLIATAPTAVASAAEQLVTEPLSCHSFSSAAISSFNSCIWLSKAT